ncbi:MAG TPA: hypothetical protein VK066_22380 [Chloroflexota bacterium]|nr:hypothetical protein [Chloroflexota bacterium]
MERISVYVEPEQAHEFRQLAGEDSRAIAALVREALGEYLARRRSGSGQRTVGPRRQIPEGEWQARFAAALAGVRAGISPDTVGENLEAEITAARAEVRRSHHEDPQSARG